MIVHNNARTNKAQRTDIQESSLAVKDLSLKFCVTEKTIRKWRNRDIVKDKSSRPLTIHYALTQGEQALCVAIRKMTWFPADDLAILLKPIINNAGHSNVSRTLKRFNVSTVPKEEKQRKKFKDYEPGYIHIDLTYVPELERKKRYVFVAIDRATRIVHFKMMNDKSSRSAEIFLEECLKFFPYKIKKILTDNGFEFTNRRYARGGKNNVQATHKFDKVCDRERIEHRTTKIKSPWTNGLVERVIGIMKENTIKRYRYKNIEEMESSIKSFEVRYNMFRRHKSLGRKTPYQVTVEWYEKKPELFNYHPTKLNNFYGLKSTTW